MSISLFDAYLGLLTTERCDAMMWKYINKEWVAEERGLMMTKWFDYRFMHPVVATAHYAQAYHKAYLAAWRQHKDHTRTRAITNEPNIFKLEPTTRAGLWRGRQMADAIGMPYDVYLSMAFEEALRFWRQSELPRPAQLYAQRIIDRLVDRWHEYQGARIRTGTHPEFQVARFVGSKPQIDHRAYLAELLGRRGHPAAILARFVKDGLLEAA